MNELQGRAEGVRGFQVTGGKAPLEYAVRFRRIQMFISAAHTCNRIILSW